MRVGKAYPAVGTYTPLLRTRAPPADTAILHILSLAVDSTFPRKRGRSATGYSPIFTALAIIWAAESNGFSLELRALAESRRFLEAEEEIFQETKRHQIEHCLPQDHFFTSLQRKNRVRNIPPAARQCSCSRDGEPGLWRRNLRISVILRLNESSCPDSRVACGL